MPSLVQKRFILCTLSFAVENFVTTVLICPTLFGFLFLESTNGVVSFWISRPKLILGSCRALTDSPRWFDLDLRCFDNLLMSNVYFPEIAVP